MSRKKVIISNRSLSIGLDVDYKTSYVVVIETETGSAVYEGRIDHDRNKWSMFLSRFPGCCFWACYEAGGIGFWLFRYLRDLGVDCHVIAPTQVAKMPNARKQKNDRADAWSLAQMFWNQPRSWVRVPTEQEEADRQLIRTRNHLIDDRGRIMNRIKSHLVYYHIQLPEGTKTDWSKVYRQHLSEVKVRFPAIRIALDVMLNELDAAEKQISLLNREIAAMNRTERYQDKVSRLCQIQGVGPLTANAFLTEIFRPEEFRTPQQLAAHLGLTPCEWSSGKSHRQGHITRWGPSHLRKLLVEAAWAWVLRDPEAGKRFQEIRAGKAPKVAIVAMARRLAVAMWAILVKEQDYNYRWAS